MVSIRKSIDISAPITDVYDWVQWAPNFVDVWPNVVKTVNYAQDKHGLGTGEVIYSMMGIEFKTDAQDIEKIPYKKIVIESKKPLDNTFIWRFEESPDGTRLDLTVDYVIPFEVLRSLAEKIVERSIEKDINTLLENIKQELERLHRLSVDS